MSLAFKPRFRTMALLATVALWPAVGSAQLVYTNGVPDNYDGYPVSSPTVIANDFTLATTTQLGSFEWYVLRSGTNGPQTITSNFFWGVLNDVGGTPGSTFQSGAIYGATGTRTPFFCCYNGYAYDAYLFTGIALNFTLDAGTYWLAISNYEEIARPGYTGYWSTSAEVGNQQESNGYGWSSTGVEGAFSIYGNTVGPVPVPEPTSIFLVATGLAGVVGAGRRRTKRRCDETLIE